MRLTTILLLSSMFISISIAPTSAEENQEVDAKVIMEKIEQGIPVSYDGGCYIKGNLDFSRSNLSKKSFSWQSPQGIMYSEDLWLVRSPINIIDCEIDGNVNFSDAVFEESISFSGTFLHRNVSFKGSRFGKKADFHSVKFNGTSDFSKSKFPQFSTFFGSVFEGNAYFEFSQFNEVADFENAFFNSSTSFDSAQFNNRAEFQGSNFNDITFWNSQFDGDARFWNTIFGEDAIFNYAMFAKNVEFYGASFHGDARFDSAIFLGTLDLTAPSSEGYKSTKFLKNLSLDNAQINIIRLSYAEFPNKSTISLNGSHFQSFLVPWSVLDGRGNYDRGTYLSLIRNYNELGWFEDADKCNFQYRWIGQDQNILGRLKDAFSFISMGFGVYPIYGFISWFIVVVFFAIVYYKTKCICGLQSLKDKHSLFIESLYQSLLVFTTNAKGFNWEDKYVFNKYNLKIKCKYLGVIEGIIGWSLMALFLVTLAKILIR